jgi:hypothetical protein
VQVDDFNAIDMANVMYSFVAMRFDPGLLILDAVAGHVNDRYHDYGPAEMAQVLYGFATYDFHPGAVYGRVAVVCARNPGVFDKNSRRLMQFVKKVFDARATAVQRGAGSGDEAWVSEDGPPEQGGPGLVAADASQSA